MKIVKELKQEIDSVIVSGYTYQNNLSWKSNRKDNKRIRKYYA